MSKAIGSLTLDFVSLVERLNSRPFKQISSP